MSNSGISHAPHDPLNLGRFVEAQDGHYEQALAEIRRGRKRSHWMWYIFPQIDGLAFSTTARRYSIKNIDEAQAYLDHLVLGPRLLECMEAILLVEGRSAWEIFGTPDDLKLRSCATLFASVSPPDSVFERVLAQYYHGIPDSRTLELLDLDLGTLTKPPLTLGEGRGKGALRSVLLEFLRRRAGGEE